MTTQTATYYAACSDDLSDGTVYGIGTDYESAEADSRQSEDPGEPGEYRIVEMTPAAYEAVKAGGGDLRNVHVGSDRVCLNSER